METTTTLLGLYWYNGKEHREVIQGIVQGGIELATVGLWSKYLMSLDPVAPTATLLAVTLLVRRLSMYQEILDGGTPTQAAVSKAMSVSRPKRQEIKHNS